MQTITITLDGVEVSGSPGMTVLELARESGVEIPTLCYDSNLSPHGACRLCLVEDDTTKAIIASCATPIRAGMVINTKSPRVLERRKTILELLLASHPDTCMVCDRGNNCQLRKIASEMGIGRVRFQRIPQIDVIEELNPFIARDMSKCILCARCIRADQELVVEGAIDYADRGFAARPATANDVPLEQSECTFCGACVAVCPVGALIERDRAYHGTAATAIDTTCPFCGCGCGIRLEVKDNRVVRSTPMHDAPVNHGALCVRGSYGYDFVHSPDRLTRPMVKTAEGFKAVSWEEALTRVAADLGRIIAEHGPDSVAVIGSSKCTNEENYVLQRLARAVLGTNNVDNGSRLYSAASIAGLGSTTGFPGSTSVIGELEKSDAILVIGANPTSSAPAVAYAIKRAVRSNGARLLLLDPYETKLRAFAYTWLRPKPGTDIALLNAMAKVILDENLQDAEFVNRHTDNFAGLANGLMPYQRLYAAEATGVPAEDIALAARVFGKAERASIVFGDGVTRQAGGEDCVKALANLAMLTGNMGDRGGGIFALKQENNAQGACDMGALPEFLPGYRDVLDVQAGKELEGRWGTSLPRSRGLTLPEMIDQAVAGKVKAMLVMGENPALSLPDSNLARRALSSLDMLVVSDLFLTETARLATEVLPAASFAEKDGTFTNFEGRVQAVRKAIAPPGESLSDFDIIVRLSEKMGRKMPYSIPQDATEEIRELVPWYDGATGGGIDADDPGELKNTFAGTRRLYGGTFPKSFSRFAVVEYSAKLHEAADEYPIRLTTGSIQLHFGSGTRSFHASRLKKFSPGSWIEISDSDAVKLGIGNGDIVRVVSRSGEITTTARTSGARPAATAFLPMSFPDAPVNELLELHVDAQGGKSWIKECAVRLERIGSNV